MKKFVLLLLSLLATSLHAEPVYAEHPLMVHRLSYWAPEYLTVTNNWDNLCFPEAPSTLKSLSVITEINGQSTKDMEEEDFYAIIDKESSFTITYITKVRGENKTYTKVLAPLRGKLFLWDASDVKRAVFWPAGIWSDEKDEDEHWYYCHYDTERVTEVSNLGYSHTWYKKIGLSPSESTTLMADHNIDFFQYNTFDYMVAGDDYITDLGLVQAMAKELEKKGLKYNPENPDLHLFLTKNAQTRIESIYVPNITTTTHSTTRTTGNIQIYYGNYNTWGNGSSRTIGKSVSNIRDNGETKSLVDADLYLQLSILDAKRMNNNNPPIVWQIIHNHHFTKEVNITEWAKRLHVAVYNYPLSTQISGRRILTWGIFFKNYLSKSGMICNVVANGWADNHGLKQGNTLKKIISIDVSYHKETFNTAKGQDFTRTYPVSIRSIQFDNIKIEKDEKGCFEYSYFFIPEKAIQ